MTRYDQIKELIEFNLNTTLRDLEIYRGGVDDEGEPVTITIEGNSDFGKRYSLVYEYEWLKEKQDAGKLSRHLLEIRESILIENS